MRSVSDDELYSVAGRYLGPPGHTIPWQARYSAYLVWAAYFVAGLIIRAQLRIFSGGGGYVVIAVGATVACVLTMRLVSPERSASAVAAMVWAELSAPRPGDGKTVCATLVPRHLVITEQRPRGGRRTVGPARGRRRRKRRGGRGDGGRGDSW